MTRFTFVGAVTEYRASSLERVQQRGVSAAAHAGTGGGA
jgi:hypothetical protein